MAKTTLCRSAQWPLAAPHRFERELNYGLFAAAAVGVVDAVVVVVVALCAAAATAAAAI